MNDIKKCGYEHWTLDLIHLVYRFNEANIINCAKDEVEDS